MFFLVGRPWELDWILPFVVLMIMIIILSTFNSQQAFSSNSMRLADR